MGYNIIIIYDTLQTSISCNSLGILGALYKLKLVMSSKINKTFTKTSVWIPVQLIVGMIACILLALVGLNKEKVINSIGETATTILIDVLYFIIYTQPEWTTVSQAYEWYTTSDVIEEQKHDNKEETFQKINVNG